MTDSNTEKPKQRGEWYEVDTAWDVNGYASVKLMNLGETREWLELVQEASQCTHATADEVWEGMAAALRGYLESLDNLTAFDPYEACQFVPKERDTDDR